MAIFGTYTAPENGTVVLSNVQFSYPLDYWGGAFFRAPNKSQIRICESAGITRTTLLYLWVGGANVWKGRGGINWPVTKDSFIAVTDGEAPPAAPMGLGFKGLVTDAATRKPIDDATIRISPTGEIALSIMTGEYDFDELTPGKYRVTATKSGYVDKVFDTVVSKDILDVVNIGMTPEAPPYVPLEPPTGTVHFGVIDSNTKKLIPGTAEIEKPDGTFLGRIEVLPVEDNEITDLYVGKYVIIAEAPGYQQQSRSFDIVARETVKLGFVLTPLAVPPRAIPSEFEAPILVSPDDMVLIDSGKATRFEWDYVSGASSYDIWFDGIDFPEEIIDTSGLNYWTLTSDAIGRHKWKVRAKTPLGVHDWSEERMFTIVKPVTISEPTKRWRDFQKNPDVIKALGTISDATLNSFSRVFQGWDIYEEKEHSPEPVDYFAVGSILVGISLLAVASVLAVVGATTSYAVVDLPGKYVVVSRTVYAERALSGAAQAAVRNIATAPTKAGAIQWLTTSEGVISTTISGAPGKAILIFKSLGAIPMKYKIAATLSSLFLVTQLDATGWFFGLSPEASHRKAETLLKAARGDLIRLDDLVDNENWSPARELSQGIKAQLEEIKRIMGAWPKEFWEKFGFSFDDKDAMLNSLTTNHQSYLDQYPQLTTIIPLFPEIVTVENVKIVDGDSIEYPGHPEVMNEIRFVGIDTHEIGTDAGVQEANYLDSLIGGKTVTLKIDPYADNQIGLYGRLLAVPYLDQVNIGLKMLEYFGEDILTATRYQDKHKYIDWDEYKRVAKASVGPGVVEFKINIDSAPSNAKLYIDGTYTHHFTPSNEKELKDVMDMLAPGAHIIKVTKAGKSAQLTVNITEGVNPPLHLILSPVGLPAPEVLPEVIPVVKPEVPDLEVRISAIETQLKLILEKLEA